jgi:chemotaxis protein MotA
MDRISVIGLLIGLAAILGGQVLEGGHVSSLFQMTALAIVGGGTLGAVLLQSPQDVFMRGIRMAKWVWVPPVNKTPQMIASITNWANMARREGLLVLENQIGPQKDPFVRKGLQLLVDGAEPDRLREVLDVDIVTFEDSHRHAARIWESAGGYAPTIGIIGAVMGLIHVMENLSEPSKLGAGIAVAFVATIYGVGLANLVFLPINKKLQAIIGRQVRHRELIVDGLIGIANGDNPRIIESRLRGYLD